MKSFKRISNTKVQKYVKYVNWVLTTFRKFINSQLGITTGIQHLKYYNEQMTQHKKTNHVGN